MRGSVDCLKLSRSSVKIDAAFVQYAIRSATSNALFISCVTTTLVIPKRCCNRRINRLMLSATTGIKALPSAHRIIRTKGGE